MATEIQIRRAKTARGESITLLAETYAITIELTIRGLELDQTAIERMLHAPLTALMCETT